MTSVEIVSDKPMASHGDEGAVGALHTDRGNLPMRRLDLCAAIVGLSADVTVTQVFHNPHDVPVEATYIFPLPAWSAVTGMRMIAGDRVVEAVLQERAAARAAYEQAVTTGHRAAIAEEDRPDVFTVRVGNILPREEVTITIWLAQRLSYVEAESEFRFPLVVAPRYIPGAAVSGEPVGTGWVPDTDAVPDASRITPPVLLPGFPDPITLSITVSVDPAGLACTGIASSLPVSVGADGLITVVPGQRLDRDFILRLRHAQSSDAPENASDAHGNPMPASAIALTLVPDHQGDQGTYRLTLMPPTGQSPSRPRDVVLLLDRSGSMGGWKMVAARRAASRIIDTLTLDDHFAVLTFDHEVERPVGLPAGLVSGSDRHRYRAVEHLAQASARGGTDILPPLQEALRMLGSGLPGRRRIVVLVTDGQVGNEDQILAEAGAGFRDVTVHTVGIDQSVNAGFLGRLAALGGGRCELVESEDRLDGAMDRIRRRIATPVLSGLQLTGRGIDMIAGSATPARSPDLHPGVPLVLAGRYRATSLDPCITLTAIDGNGAPWQAEVSGVCVHAPSLDAAAVSLAAGPSDPRAGESGIGAVGSHAPGVSSITALWARAHLRDLEDRYTISGDEALVPTIVDTSLRFGVLCRFTAYVAVDTQVATTFGQPHQIIQPVELPAGWERHQATRLSMVHAAAPAYERRLTRLRSARVGEVAPVRKSPPAGVPAPSVQSSARLPQPTPAHLAPAQPASDQVVNRLWAGVFDQLIAEVGRLRDAPVDIRDQADFLDDLASRLVALIAFLGTIPTAGVSGSGVSARGVFNAIVPDIAGMVANLTDLAAYLRDDQVPVADRWTRALRDLKQLIDDHAEQSQPSEPPAAARRPRRFWAR